MGRRLGPLALAASLFLAAPAATRGQVVPAGAADVPTHPPHAIQDNSFLVEEAYNQEEGYVQNISQFSRDHASGDWLFTFTQEWPVPGNRHQLSVTLPVERLSETHSRGPGDAALNYRYQLVGDDKATVAVAPRLTLFLPSGSSRKGLGAGSEGWQIGIPVSLLLSDDWIAHGNLGGTWTPSTRNPSGQSASTTSWGAAGSVIWIGSSLLDVMVETTYSELQTVVGPGRTAASFSCLVSPGIRWAYDFRSGLQVVPGIAFPIGVGPSRGSRQILLYLSFEHPFRKVGSTPAP